MSSSRWISCQIAVSCFSVTHFQVVSLSSVVEWPAGKIYRKTRKEREERLLKLCALCGSQKKHTKEGDYPFLYAVIIQSFAHRFDVIKKATVQEQ